MYLKSSQNTTEMKTFSHNIVFKMIVSFFVVAAIEYNEKYCILIPLCWPDKTASFQLNPPSDMTIIFH